MGHLFSGHNRHCSGLAVLLVYFEQYYFDTLFPRTPVPIMRQIVANLEKMKLPSKHSGVTGETNRHGSDDTARRPPSVKAALSVSFGQRAPHRASTRDSSPVRRTLPPPHDRNNGDDGRRSPSSRRSRSREFSDRDHSDRDRDKDKERERERERNRDRERDKDGVRERDRDRDRERARDRDRDRERDKNKDRRHEYDRRGSHESRDYYRSKYSDGDRESSRRDHERSRLDGSKHRESSSRRSRSRSQSRSRSRSRSLQVHNHYPSPLRDGNKEKTQTSASSNLAKLKDLYGDTGDQKGYSTLDRGPKDSSSEEVIRLGGSTWR